MVAVPNRVTSDNAIGRAWIEEAESLPTIAEEENQFAIPTAVAPNFPLVDWDGKIPNERPKTETTTAADVGVLVLVAAERPGRSREKASVRELKAIIGNPADTATHSDRLVPCDIRTRREECEIHNVASALVPSKLSLIEGPWQIFLPQTVSERAPVESEFEVRRDETASRSCDKNILIVFPRLFRLVTKTEGARMATEENSLQTTNESETQRFAD